MSKRYPTSTICEGRECIPSIGYKNVFFLLDHPSPELDKEQSLHDDMFILTRQGMVGTITLPRHYITGLGLQ